MKVSTHPMTRTALAASLALVLVACGGGSNAKTDTPPVSPPPTSPPPPPPPPTTPPPPPPPPLVQPATNAHLALTNAASAHAAGFTGAGYRIGVVDSGVNRNHPTLAGRVVANYNYVDPAKNNLNVDDVVGHGTVVAQLAAGAPVDSWPGGMAQGAQIVSARIIADKAPEDDGSGDGNEVDGALGLASIHRDLIRAGVKIMNNSWGGLYWTNPAATSAIAAEYRPFIADNGGLVVFATGNESRTNPTDMASLPSQAGASGSRPAADLERGWLAVAALDTSAPTQLMWYSNACGVAKNYCLVAPGTAMFLSADSTASNLSYRYGSGTSYAAPLVSGAAALVWEAFPYFSNDLVRQTLLGTAKDLGAPGVDDIYGYGLLDVGKAVKGPSKFDWGDVTVAFDGTSTWGNELSGEGGLIKRGAGTLVLGGTGVALDYKGDTRVQQGVLNILGNLNLSNVQVESGGRLAGTAAVGANLTNAGRVDIDAAGAATGGMQVAGNYLQQAGGRLAMTLGNGQLQVKGTATLQGGDVHVLGVRNGYITQSREYVLTAPSGLTGRFDALTAAPSVFLDATLGYSGTQAWMDINRLNVTATAASLASITPASLGSAARMEAAFEQVDAQQGKGEGVISDGFIRAASAFQQIGNEQAAVRALQSLSGDAHAAASAMTFDSIDMNRRALSARFEQAAGQRHVAGSWYQSLGGVGQGSYAGSGADLSGWMLGNAMALGERGTLGMAFGETRVSAAGEMAGDHHRDRQTQAQLFAGWNVGDSYVLGQAGFGHFDRQLERHLSLGALQQGVRADYNGSFLSSSLEAGHRFGNGTSSLTPYLGAEHARLRSDGFQENGGTGFGLQAAQWRSSRTQLLAGLRGHHQWGSWRVNGYAEWQQAVASDGLTLDASFTGVEAWSPLSGLQPSASGGLIGVSLQSWLSPTTRFSMGYDQRFGPRGDNRQVALRYLWDF